MAKRGRPTVEITLSAAEPYVGYVNVVQYPAGLVGYVKGQLGLPIPSTAPLAKSS